ncbi:UNVERIFIED_CONTAM: hypothetical protein K2H54_054428 [Gekko kuhli]
MATDVENKIPEHQTEDAVGDPGETRVDRGQRSGISMVPQAGADGSPERNERDPNNIPPGDVMSKLSPKSRLALADWAENDRFLEEMHAERREEKERGEAMFGLMTAVLGTLSDIARAVS